MKILMYSKYGSTLSLLSPTLHAVLFVLEKNITFQFFMSNLYNPLFFPLIHQKMALRILVVSWIVW